MAQMKTRDLLLGFVGILVVVFLILWATGNLKMGVPSIPTPGTPGYVPPPTTNLDNCADDKDLSLTFDVKNTENSSSNQEFDVTAYIYQLVGDDYALKATVTDTTGASATTINLGCGEDYMVKVIGTTGAQGDGSIIDALQAGAPGELKNGNWYFHASNGDIVTQLSVSQHALLETKFWDYNGAGWVYDNADNSATGFEGDATTYTSVTNNATAMDETVCINGYFTLQAATTDSDVQDRDLIVLFETPKATWDKPTVSLNGVALADATLNEFEEEAYDAYEYAFLIPRTVHILDGAETAKLDLNLCLKSGVASSSVDPEMDFAVRTQVLSIDGSTVIESAVTDAGTPAQVMALHDITFDVT